MIISAVTLFIGSTTVLAALEAALERIWQGEIPKRLGYRHWPARRVLSLAFCYLALDSAGIADGLDRAGEHAHRTSRATTPLGQGGACAADLQPRCSP